MLGRIKNLTLSTKRCVLLGMYLCILSYIFIFSSVDAQQEYKSAWIWSVKAGDIMGSDPTYTPVFYMPKDEVRISWNITPSEDVTFRDAELRIYPKDADRFKYIVLDTIVPNEKVHSKYYPLNDNMSLVSKLLTKNERIYNVEINANGLTRSKLVNETHIIEILVKEPSTLEIHKRIPILKDANLSNWVFWIEGPLDAPKMSINRTAISNDQGIAILPDLRPGTYKITETVKDGWATKRSPRSVAINPGEQSIQEFENTPNSIKICTISYLENKTFPGISFMITPERGSLGTVQTQPTDNSGCTKYTALPSCRCKIDLKPQGGCKLVKPIPFVYLSNGGEESLSVTVAKTGTLRILKKDSEGQPIKGITFSISGPDPNLTSPTVPTDDAGTITISDLLPGEYIINEIIPENLRGKWRPNTEISQKIMLEPAGIATVQFINEQLLTLRITKYDEYTKKGLPGWMFTIDGPEGVKRVGPTNSQGMIAADVIPGKYIVTEEISQTSHPGWVCTSQNPQHVEISSKLPNEVKFGNRVNRIIITKFDDRNLNGKFDNFEEGLMGWNFTIKGPNGQTRTTPPTNTSGMTVLEGLIPGDYIVSEVVENNWINTTPSNRFVPMKAGVEQEITFGNVKSNIIEIFKFNDTNRNGKADKGESGLSGWIFTIKGTNGYLASTEPTNADGIAIVEGVLPGNYTLTENPLEGWLSTTPSAMSVSLGFGDRRSLNFGNYYCLRCHRITDSPKNDSNSNSELMVIKEVSNISADKIDKDNGYVVNYNITLCPSRGLSNIADIPTDIVIAVDNSPSISLLNRSALAGVKNLVEAIRKHDKLNGTRIGLVSWSDKNNSRIEVPLTNSYDSIITNASSIKFAEGKHTNYQNGLDTALEAFNKAGMASGRDKKIVIITDANNNSYQKPVNMVYSGYAIFAVVVGDADPEPFKMLEALTKDHKGYVVSLNNLSGLGGILTKMATAGPRIKDVHLVEVLPNYLVLLNSTATDDKGKVQLNDDGADWTTTTIEWDIGDLSECWSTDFQGSFCWKLPADVNQPKRASFVNYTDEKGVSKTLELPGYEINIVPAISQKTQEVGANAEEKKQPGFEAIFAAIGLFVTGYLCRRRC